MKYTNSVVIKKPLGEVIEKYDNEENLPKWQKGLVSITLLSGEHGAEGSTYKILYRSGKREIEMIETLLVKNLPEEMTFRFDAGKVCNVVSNHFKEISENETLLETETTVELKGIMKLFGLLMPGMFKKQSQTFLDAFKSFAETGASVS